MPRRQGPRCQGEVRGHTTKVLERFEKRASCNVSCLWVMLFPFQSPKPKWHKRYSMIQHQEIIVQQLVTIMSNILTSKDDRIKRVITLCHSILHSLPPSLPLPLSPFLSFQIERLRSMLIDEKSLLKFHQPIRLPVDPHTQVHK